MNQRISFSIALILIMLVACSPLAARSSIYEIQNFENKLKPALSSPGYLVVERTDWEIFKGAMETRLSEQNKRQDSLRRIVKQQADSLMMIKNFAPKQMKQGNVEQEAKSNDSLLAWSLAIVFAALLIIELIYVFDVNTKIHDVKEERNNYERRYEESQRHWIDLERKLKRELIDANEKIRVLKGKV